MPDARVVSNQMLAAMSVMGRHMPTSASRSFGGAHAMVTGLPLLSFNTMWVVGEPSDDDIPEALEYLASTGYPYSAILVNGLDDRHIPTLEYAGMQKLYDMPLMLCEEPIVPRWLPELGRTDGPATLEDHRSLVSEVFNLNPEQVDAFISAEALGDPDVYAVVGSVDAIAVTTAIGSLVDGTLGVFNVATTEIMRGRGYGAAATGAILEAGFGSGATRALLQSSPIGVSVYEALGFKTVATHDRWGYPAP